MNFRQMTKRFLLGESYESPNTNSYIQSIKEVLDALKPSSQSDKMRVEMAQSHLREIKRNNRRLQEKVNLLEERVRIFEEGKKE
jgi:uridine kinase|tara:strand:+ start:2335 stop:2586 length:252 start_codon:yes stop_codon:yes gene_type:complete